MRTRCTRPRIIRKMHVPAYEPWPAGVHACEYSGVVMLWKNTITMPSMEWPEWSELPDMSIPMDDAAASLEAVAVGMWSWWSIFVMIPGTNRILSTIVDGSGGKIRLEFKPRLCSPVKIVSFAWRLSTCYIADLYRNMRLAAIF